MFKKIIKNKSKIFCFRKANDEDDDFKSNFEHELAALEDDNEDILNQNIEIGIGI